MAKNTQTAKDYGDPWINRLALMMAVIQKMDQRERDATLDFIFSKYPR